MKKNSYLLWGVLLGLLGVIICLLGNFCRYTSGTGAYNTGTYSTGDDSTGTAQEAIEVVAGTDGIY